MCGVRFVCTQQLSSFGKCFEGNLVNAFREFSRIGTKLAKTTKPTPQINNKKKQEELPPFSPFFPLLTTLFSSSCSAKALSHFAHRGKRTKNLVLSMASPFDGSKRTGTGPVADGPANSDCENDLDKGSAECNTAATSVTTATTPSPGARQDHGNGHGADDGDDENDEVFGFGDEGVIDITAHYKPQMHTPLQQPTVPQDPQQSAQAQQPLASDANHQASKEALGSKNMGTKSAVPGQGSDRSSTAFPCTLPLNLDRGSFQLERPIGAGASGRVHFGHLVQAGKPGLAVAVKELHASTEEERSSKTFHQEARLLAECSHVNICRLYGVCHHQSTYYLIMEYAFGRRVCVCLSCCLSCCCCCLSCCLSCCCVFVASVFCVGVCVFVVCLCLFSTCACVVCLPACTFACVSMC